MKRIALIRHGATDWNYEGRIQGQIDVALNEAGRQQAEALAARLKGQHWDLLVSSDLSRAVDTSKAICRFHSIPFKTDSRLRERSYGKVEGTTRDERLKRWGADWHSLDHGGESDRQLSDRALEVWREMVQDPVHENILLVSHGGWIYQLIRALFPDGPFAPPIDNTSFSLLQHVDGKWICDPYNSIAHL